MKKLVRYLFTMGYLKTIVFNLRYFPFTQAIHMPVLLARKVKIKNCRRGAIKIQNVCFGCMKFGFLDTDFTYTKPSFLNIKGTWIVKGFHHNFAPGLIVYIGEEALLEMDDLFSVSHDTKIHILRHLKIGYNNMWSYRNVIMDTDGHPIYDENGKIENPNEDVVFGDNVWMGCNSTILKGSIIPDNTIIASCSLINKKILEGNCIISAQGKVLKTGVHWKREFME